MTGLKQSFQADGPMHAEVKGGTPTAGGAIFIPVGLVVGLCYAW